MRKRKKKAFNVNGYILGAFRKIWRWWPDRKKALDNAQTIIMGVFICHKCQRTFTRKQVQVDHIVPVVRPEEGMPTVCLLNEAKEPTVIDWATYAHRLFVPARHLQVLCKPCHKKKSTRENRQRKRKEKVK